MLEVSLLLMLLTIICKLLITYIKAIRTGDPNESELTYWMFSYDFKSRKKQDFTPDAAQFVRRKKFKNRLVFTLYIIVFIQFLLLNSFLSQFLILISS